MIYFDNAATTYPKPDCVYKAADYANRKMAFNSGRGMYKEANDVSNMILETRNKIATLVNKTSDDVVFTSSATESLNLIINGIDFNDGDNVYVSPFEHNAIIRPLFNIKKAIDINVIVLPFDSKSWKPDVEKIENEFIFQPPKAIFISQVSNVTGLEIEYESVFSLSKEYDSINVLDSSQAFGVSNPTLDNVDFCVFAGHKSLYSTLGIAGFIVNTNYVLKNVKTGGNGSDSLNHDMPSDTYRKYECGSANSVGIFCLNKSIDWLDQNDVLNKEKELTRYFIDKAKLNNKLRLYLPEELSNIVGIVSFNVEGYTPDEIGNILYDEFGIMVRTGYHCSPFVHDFIMSKENYGTVRVSFSYFNTYDEIDTLISALESL